MSLSRSALARCVCGRTNRVALPRRPASTSTHAALDRLKPVLTELPPLLDWAVAYGSGVIHQANASATGPQPMTDFLVSTPDSLEFHKDNLRANPSHYPFWARTAGEKTIAAAQEQYGAGIWYVTMVNICGLYGVISSARLRRDLEEWDTLYVAGRLHKPVLTLQSTPSIDAAQQKNLQAALAVALLVLPPEGFTANELWEQIAGISYSGDPRMSVPGAENPDKVKNIVRGPGNLEGFRRLYGDLLRQVPELRFVDKEDGGLLDHGDRPMLQSGDLQYRARLLAMLPMRAQIQQKMSHSLLGKVSTDVQAVEQILQHQDFRKSLLDQLRSIIGRPALSQSVKGLATAGVTKSFHYSLAKFRKWLKARGATRK